MKYPQLLRSSGLCFCFLLAASILPQADAAAHIVRNGETLSSIGRQHHVSVRALTRANPKVNPHLIFKGQAIQLPGDAADSPRSSSRKQSSARRNSSDFDSGSFGSSKEESSGKSKDGKTSKTTKSSPATAKAEGKKPVSSKSQSRRDADDDDRPAAKSKGSVSAITRYKVQKGDTLFTIAGKNGTTVKQLMAMNKMSSSNLSLGQSLLVPVAGGRTAAETRKETAGKDRDRGADRDNDAHAVDISPPPPRQRGQVDGERDSDSNSSTSSGRGTKKSDPAPKKRDRDDDNDAPRGVYYHVVKRNEDFSSIAAQHNVSWGDLYRANRGITPETLKVNQRIMVPKDKVRDVQPSESSRTQLASRSQTQTKSSSSGNSSRSRSSSPPSSSERPERSERSLASSSSSRAPSRLADTTISMEPPPPLASRSKVAAVPDDPLPPLVTEPEHVEETGHPDDGVIPMTAYKVAPNETIDDIAKEFSTTKEELRKMNHMGGFDQPIPGNYVVVPWSVPSALD